jgi:hypothetical protein
MFRSGKHLLQESLSSEFPSFPHRVRDTGLGRLGVDETKPLNSKRQEEGTN